FLSSPVVRMPQLKIFGTIVAILCCSKFTKAETSLPIVDLGYEVHQATLNPPVGPLRFAAPLSPVEKNSTVTTGQPRICPPAFPAWGQTVSDFVTAYLLQQNISAFTTSPPFNISTLSPPQPGETEDCLFLDVMVPTSIFNSSQGAPVVAWIHGGGYTAGDKGEKDQPFPGLIARSMESGNEGAVFVSINYRLGLFGFLVGDNVTANAGLLDQKLALDWVQENIHLFGGDPSRVTVMGESAGAGSIMHHIVANGGDGIVPFQQAIIQSPAFQNLVPDQTKAIFTQVLANASTLAGKDIKTADDLRALSFDVLYELNGLTVGQASWGTFNFGPAIDLSPTAYVPDFPARLISQGKFHNVSVLVGHNSREGLSFAPPTVQTEAGLEAVLKGLYPTANASTISYLMNTLYPPVFNGSSGYTDAISRAAALIGDLLVGCNANILSSKLNQPYAYLFAVEPGLHEGDTPYTFFNGDTSDDDDGFPVNSTLAMIMQSYLVNYAMRGKPTAEGFPDFVLYDENETVTNIDTSGLGMQIKDPAAKPLQCAFWDAAPYFVVDPSTSTGGSSPTATGSGASSSPTKNVAGSLTRPEMRGLLSALVLASCFML
ncbi:prolyl oligopeptidase-like protein, partial [Stipitochalara longipes BDJ]